MPIIIYRKNDLLCIDVVNINFTPDEQILAYIEHNMPSTSPSDYDSIETDESDFRLENINSVVTVVKNQLSLAKIQQAKIAELNTTCNQIILGGFPSFATGTEHQYKFDMEYQANFSQQGVMLSLDPTISTVLWPTSDAGVIPHSREQFVKLCQDAQAWKATNTYRYFDLKAQVTSCETVDAVNAISW